MTGVQTCALPIFEAMLSGEDLSEEFKEKAAVIFEAAVNARANEVIEAAQSDLQEQFEIAVEEIKEEKANELSDVSNEISVFFKTKVVTEAARDWLINRGKIDINEDAKSLFKDNLKKKHMLKNNNAPITQVIRKSGKIDDVRDGDVASNSDYIFKTYEQSQPTLKINPKPKVRAFDTDKETKKSKKEPMNSTLRGKVINTPGVGDQYDTRTSGSVYPMSGLGDVTYRESFNKFRSKIKESIDDPGSTDIGMYGGIFAASNAPPISSTA